MSSTTWLASCSGAGFGSLAFLEARMRFGLNHGFGFVPSTWKPRCLSAAPVMAPADARRRIPVRTARFAPGDSLGVVQRSPLHRHGQPASTPAGLRRWFPTFGSLRFGPTLPGVRSCSTFAVSHRLDGFLRMLSCGFVAPRCRSWASPGFGSLVWFPFGFHSACRSHQRFSPSKLFPRQQPCLFRGLLPSCR